MVTMNNAQTIEMLQTQPDYLLSNHFNAGNAEEMCSLFRGCLVRPEIIKKEELSGTSISLDLSLQQKNLNVRIVLAGGLVLLYQDAIPASQVMEKYPGMCVTWPEVFKRPHESIVRPEEKLLPGQKFYLVPRTTIQKLKSKHPKLQVEEATGKGLEEALMVDGEGGDCSKESIYSSKDFFVSPDRWSKCVLKRCGTGVKKPFTPPTKNARMWQKLEWQPSLTSVTELSP